MHLCRGYPSTCLLPEPRIYFLSFQQSRQRTGLETLICSFFLFFHSTNIYLQNLICRSTTLPRRGTRPGSRRVSSSVFVLFSLPQRGMGLETTCPEPLVYLFSPQRRSQRTGLETRTCLEPQVSFLLFHFSFFSLLLTFIYRKSYTTTASTKLIVPFKLLHWRRLPLLLSQRFVLLLLQL